MEEKKGERERTTTSVPLKSNTISGIQCQRAEADPGGDHYYVGCLGQTCFAT